MMNQSSQRTNLFQKIITRDFTKYLLTFILVFIFILVLLYPMAFQGLRPGGVDVLGAKGRTHQLQAYEKESGERVLWNKPVFSGMPIYHRLGGETFSFDTFLSGVLGKLLYLNIWMYLIGFIGMFFLLKELQINFWPAVLCALAYILIPHYMSLLNIGHFAKFRPIMYMPLVTFFFIAFLSRYNLLYLAGFIFSFSVQIRTQHYQIIFYQIMLLVFIGIFLLVRELRLRPVRGFIKFGLIVFASLIILLMVAQPLFVTSEYTPYSIRGGTGEEDSGGLEMDYATSWSLNPAETVVWFIPRFFGGTSGEMYQGSRVAELHGRRIPGYWGEMPFTQSYDYIGVFILFFAAVGLILNRKQGFIRLLAGLFLLALLLSFGRHFPYVYNLFFRFVPAFNKFRVPAMISVLMHLIMVIFAAYGVNSLFTSPEKKRKNLTGKLILIWGFFILLGLIPMLFGNSFKLFRETEIGQYNPGVISLLKTARLDMMQTDALRSMLIMTAFFLIAMLYLNRKMKSIFCIVLLLGIIMLDQIPFFKKAEGDLYDPLELEKRHFRQTDTDRFLLQDQDYFRIFPITENPFNNNDWSYYHNSIGGYSGAKLRIYQDLIENCFRGNKQDPISLNWEILKALNTRYIVSSQELPSARLQLVFQDKKSELFTYRMLNDPCPAWFVKNYEVVRERQERLGRLNDPQLDLHETVILEEEFPLPLEYPDSSFIRVVDPSFNHIEYEVSCSDPGLLVVSEIHYPPGWKCYLDGQETGIYKADHALRAVYINAAGNHQLRFEFSSSAFNRYYRISLLGHLLAWLFLAALIVLILRNKGK